MVEVSVIIVTRNTCALTRAAIESVPAGGGTEILVVDNGSTDETPQVLPRAFPALRYLRQEHNLGFARAVNLAARAARGEFLLLLNSDARLAPDALRRAVAWMREHPDSAVAGARLLDPDGSPQNSIANFPSLATELLNKSLLRRLRPARFPGKEQDFREPTEVESVVGAFLLTRKSVWDELGGLDERFFFFFEETDFCLRARRRGYRVVHLPAVRVWHGQGQTGKAVPAAARIEYWRSRYRYFAKHHPWSVRLALGVGLAARLSFDWLAAGLMTVLTAGRNARWRERAQVRTALVLWHLRGRPAQAGLPR
jgi:GT2 family glycosyltransferase